MPAEMHRKPKPPSSNDHPRSPGGPDLEFETLSDRAARWIALDSEVTEMQLQWQNLETALFAKAKRTGGCCESVQQSESREVRQMRALDVEIKSVHRMLEVEAGQIAKVRAETIADAIAKIELGVKVQGPFDWRDHALKLLQDGLIELRALRSEEQGVDGIDRLRGP